jgi:hypothetical protein
MHSALRLSVVVLLALFAFGLSARGADTLQIETAMVIDSLGDGEVTITFRLSASQWTVWKQQYGDRPDVLWRDLRHQFASMEIADFNLAKNDIERSATAKFAVRGGTRLRSDGSQEIELPKDMRKISESGREWIFNSVAQENPYAPILNQTIRVTLPAEAVGVRLNQPGTSFQALVYEIPQPGGGGGALLYGGVAALVAGLALGVAGFLPGKKPLTASA